MQSTFSVLGHKIFAGQRFYLPLLLESQTESEQNTDKFLTPKLFKRVVGP